MMESGSEAKALHIATYSGWYRFEQRDEQWTQVAKELTFWKLTALQVDPGDWQHVYVATEHSGPLSPTVAEQNGNAQSRTYPD